MGRLSPVLYRLFVPARHAKKWPKSMRQPKVWLPPGIPLISIKSQSSLTRLTSVLSLSQKNLDNHYCCPISAIILTTSKLEAILKIYCCSLKTVQRGRGVRGAMYSTPVDLSFSYLRSAMEASLEIKNQVDPNNHFAFRVLYAFSVF
jgi:hypothetical protein